MNRVGSRLVEQRVRVNAGGVVVVVFDSPFHEAEDASDRLSLSFTGGAATEYHADVLTPVELDTPTRRLEVLARRRQAELPGDQRPHVGVDQVAVDRWTAVGLSDRVKHSD